MKYQTANNPIVIQKITSIEEFQELEAEWNILLRKSNIQSAFLTWEWLFSWWQVFQNQNQLWLITARENQDLTAIMPLMLSHQKKNGVTFRILHPLGSPQCDVSGVIARTDSKIIRHIGEYLVQNRIDWDVLELNQYPLDSLELSVLKSIMGRKGYKITEKIYDHYFIPIDGEWDHYLNRLSRKFRKNLRRASRLADESGQVSLKHFSDNEATWSLFNTIIEINRYANFPLIYNSKNEQNFHKKLIERMSAKDMISIFLLSIDNKPVAYEYGFTYNHNYEAWRAGFDTRLDPVISIGKLLSSLVVEKAFSLDYKEIDFLRGDEAYKLEWKPLAKKYTKTRLIHNKNFLGIFFFVWLPEWKARIKSSVPE